MKVLEVVFIVLFGTWVLSSCDTITTEQESVTHTTIPVDTMVQEEVEPTLLTVSDIELTKDLLYDEYTLDDTYVYKDTTRSFKWEQIKAQFCSNFHFIFN